VKRSLKLALILAVLTLYGTLGWVAGLVVLVGAVGLGVRHVLRARRALSPNTSCPWCHADVAQYGAYSCGNCHQRTLGWAWRCRACDAWAGHITCPSCGMSVPNPLLPRP
jgi:predicted RNA-binding Zn-ribbon protein involved in translation (DUF1610 family)